MKVYVIECRYYTGRNMDCDLAHIASSKSKAAIWCRENANYSGEKHWWWAIYDMYVDGDDMLNECSELHYRNSNGKLCLNQPLNTRIT